MSVMSVDDDHDVKRSTLNEEFVRVGLGIKKGQNAFKVNNSVRNR